MKMELVTNYSHSKEANVRNPLLFCKNVFADLPEQQPEQAVLHPSLQGRDIDAGLRPRPHHRSQLPPATHRPEPEALTAQQLQRQG